MRKKFSIGSHVIGEEKSTFFIAEIGNNHQGDVKLACKMIDAACDAGADAVKFQTYITENVFTKESPFFKEFKKGELSCDDFAILSAYAKNKKITFFSTPFDFESVDFLTEIGVPAFKIASCDINNFPLLRKVASTKKPILLSTGASTLKEVRKAVAYLNKINVLELALMQCTSAYPARDEEINLRVIQAFRDIFNVPVGFSDHSLGFEIALAAVGLGACIIEKHFTIDRSIKGGDNQISILPKEFMILKDTSTRIKKALGNRNKQISYSEAAIQKRIRRCIVARRNILMGETLTEDNMGIKRPCNGLAPNIYFKLLNLKAKNNIKRDEPITLDKVIMDV